MRGDKGVCYGEGCGMGGDDFVAAWRCGVSWLRVIALVFRRLSLGVTHPQPLSRGEVWDAVFLLVMNGLSVRFPL